MAGGGVTLSQGRYDARSPRVPCTWRPARRAHFRDRKRPGLGLRCDPFETRVSVPIALRRFLYMRRLSVVLLVALTVAGCKKKESAPPVPGTEPAADAGAAIKGKVLERLDAPPYSYLKLQTDKGETWAAVPKTEAAKGSEVTVQGAMPMAGFESKTLNRKFDVVYFGTLAGAAGAPGAPGAAPAGMPPGMPP